MNLLIFLVSIFFSFIFYFFYLVSNNRSFLWYNFSSPVYFESLSWSLVIESVFFIVIGILFYLFFSDFSIKKDKDIELDSDDYLSDIFEQNSYISFHKVWKYLSIFFKKYLYYFWFIFLYLGVYFIYKSFELENFSYIVFFVNIIVLTLFFVSNKFFIFRDFIKINVILFSVFYLVFYLSNFFFKITVFPIIDILNSLFVLSSFLLVFYNDSKILNFKKLDNSLLIYFFVFIFTFFSFSVYSFLNEYIWNYNISSLLSVIWTLLSIFSYFLFTKIDFFKNNIVTLRIVSFVFAYISVLLAIYYILSFGFNILMFLILCYFIVFLFNTHNKFQNYISFFFSNLIIVFLIFYFYKQVFYIFDDGVIFLILSLLLSLEWIILTYFYDFKYKFDYYFFHLFSYGVNISSILFYLVVFKIDLFTLWIIFFIESFYIFLSYYRLKQIKNLK